MIQGTAATAGGAESRNVMPTEYPMPCRMIGMKKARAYTMVVTAKNFIAKTQSSHRVHADKNLDMVSSSYSASRRSRSSLAWMDCTSAGLRNGKRDLWTLSGKSTIRMRPSTARSIVIVPLIMKILVSLAGENYGNASNYQRQPNHPLRPESCMHPYARTDPNPLANTLIL